MIGTVFRSDDLPAEHRFDYWRELVHRAIAPSDMSSEFAGDFWARQRLLELGPVLVWPTAHLPTGFRRTEKMVRRSDPEMYHLSLVLGGGLGLEHMGRAEMYGPSDLWVSDTSRPYDVRPPDDLGRQVITGVGVDFPKALLPLPPARVGRLLGRRLSGREGTGALLTGFLTGLERQADALGPSDAPRLGTVLLDLLAAWFAQVLEAEDALPPETRERALTTRIRAFVRQNLHDPELTPPVIAAAHHISLSYLHRLFQQDTPGETVAAWIRAQRLEGARRDLANPALSTTPVHTIATRWGLPRASDFTRAFRGAYGVSPTEYRARAGAARETG
ncbi:helix-turn-helix domain-containing protein [Streptomyces sp. ID01-12c]|uniref:Helix-turn-helix domain-containing protein n=2 Tax=Streptomyces caniscabiei TaxID=2746961 RepID=A0A927L0S3_9ACTN|nr:helix-turn-helix domain-containing protein [Streptomyces caniscabiei]MBD9702887.1 helix-turn-helix domain-containing protein [Streptomyces caniscabiei]MBD9723244.1 helix-turn-helix domain-containing protein [Streptomyces caniscabiei]MDX3511924.1 helix-turn-helix domain-containing protein [Streptomyces caniscabiei]MDX3719022.1 helix-turn-helix domain-containing protein [Streptomyces caniscabiei]MDX3725827.1 helix-turn-helix domain-containing protein [Streptomyces caniscabiei]